MHVTFPGVGFSRTLSEPFFFERLLIKENSSSCVNSRPPQNVVLWNGFTSKPRIGLQIKNDVMYVRSCYFFVNKLFSDVTCDRCRRRRVAASNLVR